MPDKSIKLSALFTEEQVLPNLPAIDRDQALKKLIERLATTGQVKDVDKVLSLVLDRERLGSTILAPGVAVPHARLEELSKLHVAIATSSAGISFPGKQSQKVKLMVLVLTPAGDPGGYLQALSALARTLAEHSNMADQLSTSSQAEIWAAFDQSGEKLSDHVTARDMMNRQPPLLKTSDPLGKAIDEFCRLGISQLPVIDQDGDLAGVVTVEELIRLCLPDYITWMDDLSPILHFEPFAEVLKTETDAPVMEIMVLSDRYATVAESTPAVQVAKVMMKLNVDQVLVVRGRKLIGVITMHDFIDKVMRA